MPGEDASGSKQPDSTETGVSLAASGSSIGAGESMAASEKESRYEKVLPASLAAITIFLGAFLLFLVEPLFAKLILPRFGGSAAVWATCLVFFQSALLLGYCYAHFLNQRMSAARQSFLHIGLLLSSLLFLPIAPRWNTPPGNDPGWNILGLLTASIGLPFVLLSATGPLVQSWYARGRAAEQPYWLFALSNLASLLALLSFPFAVEPRATSRLQAQGWSGLFALFVVLCCACAWQTRNASAEKFASGNRTASETTKTTLGEKALWISLSACSSMLLLAITNHLLENVAPVPLLWVLPLSLYLLSFTLVFGPRIFYWRWLATRLLAVAIGSLGYAIYDPSFTESLQVSVPLFCAGLFLCCWFCHGELARRKPAAGNLTSFYLMIALGGALGAIFVGLVAPHIFTGIYEFPLALVLTAGVAAAAVWRQGRLTRLFWGAVAIAMIVVLARNASLYRKNTSLMVRNFYGTLRVKEYKDWLKQPYRTLYHGTIEHGAQYYNEPMREDPTTYYARNSGVGMVLDRCCEDRPRRVGAIGLGTGTLAAYSEAGDTFRFYEINPLVPRIARTSFTYLADSEAKIEVVMGDARLSMQKESPQEYDVIVVDAFSGDAIPVHLLTREAFAVYLRHLKPDGSIAVHTSNTYLELAPVVQLLATDAGYSARWISNEDNRRKLVDASDWVVVSRNRHLLDDLDSSVFMEPIPVRAGMKIWTDERNNLFQIMRPVAFLRHEAH